MVSFLQRFIGSGLVGRLGKYKLAIFCGATGDNGKSTTVDTINNIFGDYGAVSSAEMLFEKHTNNKEYYLARLTGKRFVLKNEVKDGARLAGDIVKMLVDSGETTARHPYGRVFEFQPRFTPILCTNARPVVGTDEAVWRRIWLVPFDNRVSEEDKDRGLKEKTETMGGHRNPAGEELVRQLGKVFPQRPLTLAYRMVARHAEALRSMRAIYIEAWRRDQFFLDLGAEAFRRALAAIGVTDVFFELFDATHSGIEYRYPLGLKYLAERLSP